MNGPFRDRLQRLYGPDTIRALENRMNRELDKLITQLHDRKAGWVTRRDAAETLGKAGARIADTLRSLANDKDVDVRRGIRDALGWASAGLRDVKPVPETRAYTLEELAKECEREGRRDVSSKGDGYQVDVLLKDDRSQRVYIEPFTRKDGTKLIRVFTRCGKPTEESLEWALHTNMSLTQGALALKEFDGEEEFVMTNCFLAEEASPAEVKETVKHLSVYGDYVEKKLTKMDEF